MLRLRDIMATDLITVSPNLSLRDTMELLVERHVSGVPVLAGPKVVGVISLTDLADFAASSPGVPTERPTDADAPEWEGDVTAAEDWTEGDDPPSAFFAEMWADAGADVGDRFAHVTGPEWNDLESHTVSDAMTRTIRSLPPETPLDRAAQFMRSAGIHRVLVMQGERLLGLVTTRDISDAVADHRVGTRTFLFPSRTRSDPGEWD